MLKRKVKFLITLFLIVSLAITITGCDSSSSVDEIKEDEKLIEVKADSEKGFHWDYFIYIPRNTKLNDKIRLMVEPNNCGVNTEDMNFIKESAKETAKYNWYANDLEIPVLVPVFPSYVNQGNYEIDNSLSREVLEHGKDEYERIDLQLIAMIDDARKLLDDKYNIKIEEDIFIAGISSSASFASRFTKIHPEKVRAVSAGVTDFIILPVKEWNNVKLVYPAGVSDLVKLTDRDINLEEYKDTAKFYFQGELEQVTNNLVSVARQKEEVEEAIGVTTRERWDKIAYIYNELDIPGQVVTYNATSHMFREEMIDDVLKFFEENKGDQINEIKPYQYRNDEFDSNFERVHDVNIFDAMWAYDSEIPENIKKIIEAEGIGGIHEGSLMLLTEESFSYEDQLADFLNRANFSATLKAEGEPDINLDISAMDTHFVRVKDTVDVNEISALSIIIPNEIWYKINFDKNYEFYINSEVKDYYSTKDNIVIEPAEYTD